MTASIPRFSPEPDHGYGGDGPATADWSHVKQEVDCSVKRMVNQIINLPQEMRCSPALQFPSLDSLE